MRRALDNPLLKREQCMQGPALEAGRAADMLVRWLIERKGLPPQRADIVQDDSGACSLVANQDISAGQVMPC